MRADRLLCSLLTLSLSCLAASAGAQSLRGSRYSVDSQHREAVNNGFSFLQTSSEVNRFVNAGYLVPVQARGALELHDVSYPYARPAVKLFLERLSNQHRIACGDKLTVTSLTRPVSSQPSNASKASVHPTGMAVDLRIPRKGSCRSWLESTLLSLEGTGVLDVTRERNPPHYHVALYTGAYENYVARLQGQSNDYVVRRGDSLYEIAKANDTSVAALRALNNLQGNIIRPGQTLIVTASATTAPARPVADSTHRVSAGESLYIIANLNDTTVETLRTLNKLRSNMIHPGQILSLPVTAQAAAVAAQLPAASQVSNRQHRVRHGESLYIIARQNGTTVTAIRALNGLRNDTIHPGQELQLPSPGQPLAPSAPLEHRVRRGDSLWTIARRYGTSVRLLKSSNGLNNDNLQPGQILRVSL